MSNNFTLPTHGVQLRGLGNFSCTIDKKIDVLRHHKNNNLIDKRGWFVDPEHRWSLGTWINCDLRFFDYELLSNKDFEIIYVDPPWQTSNDNYCINTLTDNEIKSLNIEKASKRGFLFMWVPSTKLDIGMDCLDKWGYSYVDRIIWVQKVNENEISVESNILLLNSSHMCLVGVKGSSADSPLDYLLKTSNDVFFAKPGIGGRKPDHIYAIMEGVLPGALKLELFATNKNIRYGWLSLGNRLGSFFEWDSDIITCDNCSLPIPYKIPRYKSKLKSDLDLCENCVRNSIYSFEDFYKLDNVIEEMTFHDFVACNICKCYPLWGKRFKCKNCKNYDVCEGCHDMILKGNHQHETGHTFDVVEKPESLDKLLNPTLPISCIYCSMYPILGNIFFCEECSDIYFCQECFFKKLHNISHNIHILQKSIL